MLGLARNAAWLILATALCAQEPREITFGPVKVNKFVSKWRVSGCPGTAVAVAQLRVIAAKHGIPWWDKTDAQDALDHKTFWGVTTSIAAGGSAGGAALTNLDIIKASTGWKHGLTIAAGTLTTLLPLIKSRVPQLDPLTDNDLAVGTNGCGQTVFYSGPGGVAFVETIK
jgi:hypothetical protein